MKFKISDEKHTSSSDAHANISEKANNMVIHDGFTCQREQEKVVGEYITYRQNYSEFLHIYVVAYTYLENW